MRVLLYWAALFGSPVACVYGLAIGLGTIADSCAYDKDWSCSDGASYLGGILFYGGALVFIALAIFGIVRLVKLVKGEWVNPPEHRG